MTAAYVPPEGPPEGPPAATPTAATPTAATPTAVTPTAATPTALPPVRRRPRALVYGDVDLNIIDGSAVWAQSVVEVFVAAGCEVTLLLKAPVRTGRLVDPISAQPGVRVVRPHAEGLVRGEANLTPEQASELLTARDRAQPYDLLVARGLKAVERIATDGHFAGRLWTYLTDVPQHAADLTAEAVTRLSVIARASRYLLCQTEELRGFLEAVVPEAGGRAVLYPPVVPAPEAGAPLAGRPVQSPVRLVYTGKFAPHWNTLEMTELPAQLGAAGVAAELHMVGDKIHRDPARPAFTAAMRTALETAPGVVWHGGMGRQEAMAVAASADFALGWRDRVLDASLELSTKVLEYGVLGLPVLLNRTPMHEALLGADYPLFVATADDVVDAVRAATADPALRAEASRRCREAVAGFTVTAAAERVRRYLDRALPVAPALAGRQRPLRVAVAGHDLKFFTRILDHLRSLSDVEVRVDEWPALTRHDEEASRALAEWADVVVCEWCGPNAAFYSRHKRPGQRLVVRLHRFELYTDYVRDVEIDAVDHVVCVSPHYARLTRETTGWPADKVVVLPNWVDDLLLDRPKLDGARFHLGFIGVAPMRKRTDLALDVLARLRRHDDRYLLFAKSKLPWDYWWIWKQEEERRHFEEVLRRVQVDPALRGGVAFDDFGADVGAWLRKIGFVLSTSDDESFHLAPAEGMASGAVPLVRDWPGAETIYDERWVCSSTDEMADRVRAVVEGGGFDEERRMAQEQVRAAYGVDRVCRLWTDLVTSGTPPEGTEPAPAPAAEAALSPAGAGR